MEKSNKRSRETNSGKPLTEKQTKVNKETMENSKTNDREIERPQWKEFDKPNNTWRIWKTPKLNKEGQLYINKLNKEPEALIEEEWPEVEDTCRMISSSAGIVLSDINPLSLWLNEVQSIPNTSRRTRKNKPLFLLASRLMASTIPSIPGVKKIINEHWVLPHTQVTLAWIAVIEKFGSFIPPPTPICYKDQWLPMKERGETILSQSITRLEERRFNTEEILIQGESGAHDICQWAVNNRMVDDSSSIPWENTIINLWNSKSRSDKEELLLSVLIRLGKTPPMSMPGWNIDRGLPRSMVNMAWLASQLKFGNLWRNKKEPSSMNELNGDIKNFFKPISSEKNETSQNRYESPPSSKNQDELSITPMEGIIINNPSTGELTTDPETITPEEGTNQVNRGSSILKKSSISRKDSTEQENHSVKGSPTKKHRSTVTFMNTKEEGKGRKQESNGKESQAGKQNGQSRKTNINPYKQQDQPTNSRRSKGRISIGKNQSKKNPLKRSILKLKLPILVDSVQEWNKATVQAVTMIRLIWKALLQVDSNNTVVFGWKTVKGGDKLKPLRIDSDIPASKGKIHGKYIDDLKLNWSNSNTPSEMRMILGHRKPIEDIIDNKSLIKKVEEMECEIIVDRIQSERRCVAGYLAGPLITESTADELADSLLNSKIYSINGIKQLEITEKEINIFQGNSKKKVKRTKAMHVFVPDSVKAKSRACLAKTFPSKVKGDYPLGIQYRFVPNTADTDFVVSTKAREIARRLKNKQAGFLDNLISRDNNHIKSIFKNHPKDENINLLKILSALRSKKYPERQLFVSIEQEYDEGPVIFQYSSEMENEADGIIPVIPLYIKGIFGDVIKYWFKPSADIGVEGYEYVQSEKKVVPSKSNVLSNLDEDWDQSTMKYDDDSISEYDSDEDDDYGGFAIEFGELKIGDKNIQSNIDDSASTGTMNLPTPKDFIDLDAGTTSPTTKGIKNIAKDLSDEFSNQLREAPLNNPDTPSTSERESDSSSVEYEDQRKDQESGSLQYTNEMESDSSSIENEDQRMDLESDQLQYNGLEDISRTNQKIILSNMDLDKGGTLNVSQSNAPKSLGKTSSNLITSNVYAPSKQDGGGRTP